MSAITINLQAVTRRIADAVEAAQRASGTVKLIAVTKTFPASAIVDAIAAGQFAFGENYVQEAVTKIAEVNALLGGDPGKRQGSAQWHFIGPIQSNKTRMLAEHFDWVHSVDRLKIAERLSDQRSPDRPPLMVLIQVNTSDEASKSGVALHEAEALARAVAALPRLKFCGLMAVPEATGSFESQRAAFAPLRALAAALRAAGLACNELSMGMSADLEAAIAEGATMVRVGTAIFGVRGAERMST